MAGTLYLLGLGVDPVRHATVEVLETISRCDKVFVSGLTSDQLAYLSRFCPSNRFCRMEEGAQDGIISAVFDEIQAGSTVGLVTLGHPFYWSALGGRLASESTQRGVQWRTFGSVSPMGVALSAAGVTIGTNVHGLQSFDYSALAETSITFNPTWPLVLYFYSSLQREKWNRAVEVLLARYPSQHPVLWCSGPEPCRRTPLKDISGCFPELSSGQVLYLGPLIDVKPHVGRTDFIHHTKVRRSNPAPSWDKG